jgi:hypothetical protein
MLVVKQHILLRYETYYETVFKTKNNILTMFWEDKTDINIMAKPLNVYIQ